MCGDMVAVSQLVRAHAVQHREHGLKSPQRQLQTASPPLTVLFSTIDCRIYLDNGTSWVIILIITRKRPGISDNMPSSTFIIMRGSYMYLGKK